MKKKGTVWVDLYNTLYFMSCTSKEIKKLQSPIFDPLDELDSAIIMGLRNDALLFFSKNNWISDELKNELIQFRNHLHKINSSFWNFYDFDNHEDWKIARLWSRKLLVKIGEDSKGWDSSNQIIFFET